MSYDPWAPTLSAAEPGAPIEVLPVRYKTADAPVLDALSGALQAYTTAHDDASGYAAAQSDTLRATGRYLDGLLEDEGQVRGPNELDEEFRSRVLSWTEVATREAIAKSVGSSLAPLTDGESVLLDPILDGWYVDDGSSVWSSHVWDASGGGVPNYPDQLYGRRANAKILDAIPLVGDTSSGRCFGVILPAVGQAVGDLLWVGDQDTECFVEDGSALANIDMAFTSSYSLEPLEAYQVISNSIEAMRAHGVRWFLLEDLRLE